LLPGWSIDPSGLNPSQPLHADTPTIIAEPSGLAVSVARSILGSVRTNKLVSFTASDTILDATNPTAVAYAAPATSTEGPSAARITLVGCTVFGKVHTTLCTLVSDCIFRPTSPRVIPGLHHSSPTAGRRVASASATFLPEPSLHGAFSALSRPG